MVLAILLAGTLALPDGAFDFTVKNASAPKVYASLASLSGKTIKADCVAADRVTLSLPAASLPVIFDAMAASLGVTYVEKDGVVTVTCEPPGKLPAGTYLLGGAILAPATPALREYLGVPGTVGMWVRAVAPGSAASIAGLQTGDLILDADGEGIGSGKDFDSVLAASREPVQTAELRVIRAKETYRFAVVVRDSRQVDPLTDRMAHDAIIRADRERKKDTLPKLQP